MHSLDSPAALRAALHEIASNLWFTWLPDARCLFEDLDRVRFAALGHNPIAFLGELDDDALASAATPAYVERVQRVLDAYRAEAERLTWWQRRAEDPSFGVAYFSMEFGLDESLPIYSGGLGVLAGDHLKSASDLGVPLVGVGLFYRHGYFRQYLDETDWQGERYPANDPARMPLTLEEAAPVIELVDDHGMLFAVRARVSRADVGRVPLYLLDTDLDDNPEWARRITDRLYGGDRLHRLRQEIVIGVGGVRALRELRIEPTVFHMNEGHSAFLQLERLRELVEDAELSRESALQRLRASTVFTTHTPVPAGNEVFDPALVERNVAPLVARCGFDWHELAALGRAGADPGFGLTPFALRTSSHANGVSVLHGEVSRDMWQILWPERPAEDVPIGSITNGVHAPTWISEELEALLGNEEDTGSPDFARAYDLDDETLWRVQRNARGALLDFMRLRGLPGAFDPDALTVGFARRFATYKRADLFLSDPDRLARLLADTERPLQIVLAGKAHPADEGGKALIQKIVAFARSPGANGRVVFLPDYEMTLARHLVQGVDVWLNNPRRPLEASGTSGMKAALNGVVNVSILDGWWAEGYSAENGFAISADHRGAGDEGQDAADADALFAVLEQHVLPTFYGDRARWVQLMRSSIAELGTRFNTNRMLAEYVDGLYLPAHRDLLAQLTAA
jgi:glycogen phosphorylase